MEWRIILIIIVSVAGPIISILFWVFVIKVAVNHAQAFEKEQAALRKLVKHYSKKKYRGKIPPKINSHVTTKLMSMKDHMNSMDSLRQQKFQTKMDGMISNVTGAGFTDFDPSSLY